MSERIRVYASVNGEIHAVYHEVPDTSIFSGIYSMIPEINNNTYRNDPKSQLQLKSVLIDKNAPLALLTDYRETPSLFHN